MQNDKYKNRHIVIHMIQNTFFLCLIYIDHFHFCFEYLRIRVLRSMDINQKVVLVCLLGIE